MTTDRETVTIRQAMAIVGVSRRTIQTWITDRKVETVRTAGGAPRIYRDTLYRGGDQTTAPVSTRIA